MKLNHSWLGYLLLEIIRIYHRAPSAFYICALLLLLWPATVTYLIKAKISINLLMQVNLRNVCFPFILRIRVYI